MPEPAGPPNPDVVCGMQVFHAPPGVDPGIHLPPVAGGRTFTMRLIEPSICGRQSNRRSIVVPLDPGPILERMRPKPQAPSSPGEPPPDAERETPDPRR